MPSATVTSKGQITVPSEIRKALGLSAGDEVLFFPLGNGQFAFRPRTGSIRDLEGVVPKLDYVPTLEELSEGISAAVEEEYLESVRGPAGDPKDEAA
jgi:antitoxin PrlF